MTDWHTQTHTCRWHRCPVCSALFVCPLNCPRVWVNTEQSACRWNHMKQGLQRWDTRGPSLVERERQAYLNTTKRSFYLKKVDALSHNWALKTYKTLLFSVQKKWMHTWGDCKYSVTKLKGYDGRKIKPLDCWGFEYNVCMFIVVIHQVLRWIKQIQKYVVFHSSGGIIHPQSQIPCSTIKPCISCMVASVSPHITCHIKHVLM